ncbi:hypothetical protein BV22DRAFT_91652 [Leucogyrophana mollusca]|uniref:Uncharacterized protein n=1 Tax=Leucogyrophana mollusca TaxID=85980 RepID=A0ACB8BXN6_9AGAM|nr:hypothetical protein BV22DRAFT_91652 [Leucogyrophana mollusca]
MIGSIPAISNTAALRYQQHQEALITHSQFAARPKTRTFWKCRTDTESEPPYQRWLRSLPPSIKKSAWTKEIRSFSLSTDSATQNGASIIACNTPGRTDDACSKRYREALDPSLKRDE